MVRSFVCLLFLAGCVSPETPAVNVVDESEASIEWVGDEIGEPVELVPVDSLIALLPAAVDSFDTTADEVYRGYFADSAGDGVAVVTVGRIYTAPSGRAVAINVSSFNNSEAYAYVLMQTGATEIKGDQADVSPVDSLLDVLAPGLRRFGGPLGRIVFTGEGTAAEVKSFAPSASAMAWPMIDLERLAELEPVPTEVDSTYRRQAY